MLALAPMQLQALVQRFRELERLGRLEPLRQRKWSQATMTQALLQEERLRTLTHDEADALYRSLPLSQRRRREFLSNPIEEVRDTLWFLLYEEAPYEIRVWEVADQMGGYCLPGADLGLVAALLCTHDPRAFGLINPTVERALRMLGLFPRFDRKESNAGRFQKLQETLWQLRAAAGFEDFREVDTFLEALAKGVLEV